MALSSLAENQETLIAEVAPPRRPALHNSAPLLLVLAVALALRLWGITWSLPNQDRYFTYHPDEGVNLVQGVLDRGGIVRPHLDLNFYNYGGLYFYMWQGALEVNQSYGAVNWGSTDSPRSPGSTTIGAMILVGRLLTVLFGVLTAWAVFALGNRLYCRNTGLLASVMWAVAPVAVVHGHYATVDVPATFFVTLTLLATAKLLDRGDRTKEDVDGTSKSSPMRAAVLAGLLAGLAGATKYNCALVLLAPVAVVFMRAQRSVGARLRFTSAVAGSAVIGFLVGCPAILVNPTGFWKDFGFELTKSREGMGLLFAETGNGWWYHLSSSLRLGLGVPLLLLCLAGLLLALVRGTRQDLLLLAFLVPYYLVIGYAQVRFLRYVIPILPVLIVFAARFAAEAWKPRFGKRVITGLAFITMALTLVITLALDRMFVTPDTRDLAKSYIDTLPAGSSVGFVWLPWYQSPPLAPGFTLPSPRSRRGAALSYPSKRLLIPARDVEWDQAVLGPPPPDAFAVSEIETGDVLRLHMTDKSPFFDLWRTRYTAHAFDKTPSLMGIDLGKPAYTPNDWLYPNPQTTVYTLNAP